MTPEQNKAIEKVKKLLAMTTSSNRHEAAVAAERAQAILAEHNLSMADIGQADESIVMDFAAKEVQSESWQIMLGTSMAPLYFSQYFQVQRPGNTVIHSFAGAEHNVVVARLMFDYLVKAVEREYEDWFAAHRKEISGDMSIHRRAFLEGCVTGLAIRIRNRLDEARRGVVAGTETTLPALASLYDSEHNRLMEYLLAQKGMQAGAIPDRVPYNASSLAGIGASERIGLEPQVGNKPLDQLDQKD